MHVEELMTLYEMDRNEPPATINHLLDFYQLQYISGKIELDEYMKIYYYLTIHGATNAHELTNHSF